MADTEGPLVRRAGSARGRTGAAVSLAVLLMIAAALTGFSVLLAEGGPWMLTTLVVATGAIAAGLLARWRAPRWRPVWSVLASSAALVVILIALFAADTAFAVVVPTVDTIERFQGLIAEGEQSIAEQELPAEADTGIRFLIALGIGALAIAADSLASLSRRPALAVVPVLGILAVPVVVDPGGLPLPTVLATAGAYLLMLALHRPAASGGRSGLARAIAVGAAVLVVALIVPPALPSVLEGSRLPGTGPAGIVTGINPVVELGDDLRRANPVTVLSYSTQLEGGQYLTLSHLAEFAGQEVLPVPFEAEREEAVELGPPEWFDADVQRTVVESTITLRSVRSRWVPLPPAPTVVQGLQGGWVIDRDGVTVRTVEGSIRAGTYTVENWVAQPTPEQLRATGVDAPGLELYRTLPDDIDPIIEATAREVVAGIDNPYEQALALQRYFTGGDFTYSEDAPVEGGFDGSGADIVAAFLDAKAGYCVHFGSAMTLMARTLGIPTRMGVGFLPGSRNPVIPSEYTVSSDDLHTWPELHFDGIGWVRFEPTPSRGVVPAYAADDVVDPSASPTPGAPSETPTEPTATASPGAPSPGASGGPELPDELIDAGGTGSGESRGLLGGTIGGVDARLVLGLALLLLIALLAVPAVWRLARRARRLRSTDPLDAWRELRDTARDLGLPAESTRTPRELAAAWAAGGGGAGAGDGADARTGDGAGARAGAAVGAGLRANARHGARAGASADADGAGRAGRADRDEADRGNRSSWMRRESGAAIPPATPEQLALFDDVRRALEARAYGAPGAGTTAPDIRPALRALRTRATRAQRALALLAPRSLATREPRDESLELPAAVV